MMAQMLTIEGFAAATVANGREALDYLHGTTKPHVILLDLMMPVMDGWEFRRRQQADPELAPVPVIVLSALDPVESGAGRRCRVPQETTRFRSPARAGSLALPLSRRRHGG